MTDDRSLPFEEARGGRRSLILPAVFAGLAFVILVGLGVWQVERLGWKEDLIARIDARSRAAPAPLPPSSQWSSLSPDQSEYRHVAATGRYEDGEALIFRGSGKIAGAPSQPGYWVMTPLRLADGAAVLVNRGFIALTSKDDHAARHPPAGDVTVTGLLRAPEDRSVFTPKDDPASGAWYTRDPVAIAGALGVARAAPFSIDEDAHVAPPGAPAGGATVIDIPNNHLSYAFTWFGLAATLVGVFAVFARRRLRGG